MGEMSDREQEGRGYQISYSLEEKTLIDPVAPKRWYKPWARESN
jgi:hypothetical protein